jgi:hypothetical protein
MGLSFTIPVSPRQRSHSQVPVSRDSWPHDIVLDSRLPQPGGAGHRILFPQEQGSLFVASSDSQGNGGRPILDIKNVKTYVWIGEYIFVGTRLH